MDIAVVEQVVDAQVEVERCGAVEVNQFAKAHINHERFVEFVLGADFFDALLQFFLAVAHLPQVGHRFVAHGREVNVGAIHPRAIHFKEPHVRPGVVEGKAVGFLRCAAHVEVFEIHGLCFVGLRAVFVAAGADGSVFVLISTDVGGSRNGEVGSEFVAHAHFHAFKHFVHIGECIVHKGAGEVVVEGSAFGALSHIGVEAGYHAFKIAEVPIVGNVA